jgi:shikimate kinase
MGTGKSSAGRVIADRLERELVEMDAIIEEREGKTINHIFVSEGEPYFRALERGLVEELSARNSLVVSTGGGVVLNPANIEDFRRSGVLFSLMAKPETVYERTKRETHRPLLATADPMKRIVELMEPRRPLYDKADHIIHTDNKSVEEVAEEILKIFSKA